MSEIGKKLKFFMGLDNKEDENEVNEYLEDSYDEIENSYEEMTEADKPQIKEQVRPERKTNMTICKYSPRDYRESTDIIDDIKGGRPVIINLEEIDEESARKVLDICSGAIYALEGEISKISQNIFVAAPKNINVMAHLGQENITFEEDEE